MRKQQRSSSTSSSSNFNKTRNNLPIESNEHQQKLQQQAVNQQHQQFLQSMLNIATSNNYQSSNTSSLHHLSNQSQYSSSSSANQQQYQSITPQYMTTSSATNNGQIQNGLAGDLQRNHSVGPVTNHFAPTQPLNQPMLTPFSSSSLNNQNLQQYSPLFPQSNYFQNNTISNQYQSRLSSTATSSSSASTFASSSSSSSSGLPAISSFVVDSNQNHNINSNISVSSSSAALAPIQTKNSDIQIMNQNNNSTFQQHSFQSNLNSIDNNIQRLKQNSASATSSSTTQSFGSTMTPFESSTADFVKKVYSLVQDPQFQQIISWTEDGKSFKIHDQSAFTIRILPLYFKHSNFSSFVRQLNKYDFHKVRSNSKGHVWEFRHDYFIRDSPFLLDQIRRKNNAAAISTSNTNTQPSVVGMRNSGGDFAFSPLTSKTSSSSATATHFQPTPSVSVSPAIDSSDGIIRELKRSNMKLASAVFKLSRQFQYLIDEVLIPNGSCDSKDQNAFENDYLRTPKSPLDYGEKSLQLGQISRKVSKILSGLADLPELSGQTQFDNGDDIMDEDDLDEVEDYTAPDPSPNNVGSSNSSSSNSLFDDCRNNNESPLAVEDDAAIQEISSSTMTKVSQSSGLKKSAKTAGNAITPSWAVAPRVLLVEDDPTCRILSSKLLQIFGCSFDVATDGLAAVNKMNLDRYDIVLMDIVMPNLDGVSATHHIRQFDRLTPIISMTSNTTENDCSIYMSTGMTDILAKPFSKANLFDILTRYCSHLTASSYYGIASNSLLQLPNSSASSILGFLDPNSLAALSSSFLKDMDESENNNDSQADSADNATSEKSPMPSGLKKSSNAAAFMTLFARRSSHSDNDLISGAFIGSGSDLLSHESLSNLLALESGDEGGANDARSKDLGTSKKRSAEDLLLVNTTGSWVDELQGSNISTGTSKGGNSSTSPGNSHDKSKMQRLK